jgi:glyoxylase-like metal-dependent hydrolase (beta-lactamase superfamily II)
MGAIRVSSAVTFWTAPHPAWRPNPEWPEEVGFETWDSPDSYVFIDPLVRDDLDAAAWDPFDRAVSRADRPVAVLLTAPWHERSVRAVAARYGAAVWMHARARDRVRDLPYLDELPKGVEVFVPRGVDEGQVAFHIVPERTLVVAEFFLGTKTGLQVAPSPGTQNAEAFAASLDELRALAIARILVAHGLPVLSARENAIRSALDSFAATSSDLC